MSGILDSDRGFTATIENTEKNKVKITFSIGSELLEKGLAQAYKENKGKISLPGFRKGKVPRKLIEHSFGKGYFYEDAVNNILPDMFDSTVIEHDIDAVSRPEIEVPEIEAGKGAVITAEVYTKPAAEVSNYTGLQYKKFDTSVSDDEVLAEIGKEREKNARLIPVTDRPVQNGDITVIDFEGSVDGVPFEGGKDSDYELNIGSNTFIPGFEDGMIGMLVGESRSINVTFPEDYHAEHLMGADAVFEVTVKEHHFKELPELDDDFAQSVSEFETLDEYKNDIRTKLTSQKENAAVQSKEDDVIDALAAKTEVDIPNSMVEAEVSQMVQGFANRLRNLGIELSDFLISTGMDISGLRNSYKVNARKNVLSRLALEAVARAEGITVSDEEADGEVAKLAKSFNADPAAVKGRLTAKQFESLKLDISVQKVLQFLLDNAVEAEPAPEAVPESALEAVSEPTTEAVSEQDC